MDSHDAAGRAGSFGVQSTDGTTIRVWVQGEGPPIVLVHGSLRDHTIFEPLIAHLRAVAAIPGARTHVLGAHGHLACVTDPGLIASIITQFVRISSARS